MQRRETLFSKSKNSKSDILYFSVKFSHKTMAYIPGLLPSFVFLCQAFQAEAVNIFPITAPAAMLHFQERRSLKIWSLIYSLL